MRYLFVSLGFLLTSSLTAQKLGLGIYQAHDNHELRLSYTEKKGHHDFQAFIEYFLKPRGDAEAGAVFDGKRYAYDSLDYVGMGGRYAFHFFENEKRISPFVGFESQFAPTALRLRLQAPDGTFQTLNFRNTRYWDNFLLAGFDWNINHRWSVNANIGGGFVAIFGIPSSFVVSKKTDWAFFTGLHINYQFFSKADKLRF